MEFPFVLDLLARAQPRQKKMFGATALYVGDKIVFILRLKKDYPQDNGVWVATTAEHHESLQKDFPSMRSITLFNSGGPTGWQNLPVEAPDFESAVERACEFVLRGDARLGKVPASRRKKLPVKRVKVGAKAKTRLKKKTGAKKK